VEGPQRSIVVIVVVGWLLHQYRAAAAASTSADKSSTITTLEAEKRFKESECSTHVARMDAQALLLERSSSNSSAASR
jgi:hypothetical protein